MTVKTKATAFHGRLTERFGKPLDRLWMGGALAVNALVWAVFGMKYIGLALVAYCFIFVLALRRRIKADYPAAANKAYHIGFIYNRPRLFSGAPEKVFLHMLWIFPAYCATAAALSVIFGSVSTFSHGLVFLICNGVLFCQYQSLFTVCCGGGRPAADSAMRKMLPEDENVGAHPSFRLVMATVLFVLVWGVVLAAYITGQMGGTHFFGIAEYGADRLYAAALGLIVPAILHIVLLKLATATLCGWGGR